MDPAPAVLVLGGDPTTALVRSQVVLSFDIPFALVPLLWLTSRRDPMGGWVNRAATTVGRLRCDLADTMFGQDRKSRYEVVRPARISSAYDRGEQRA